MTGAEDAYRCGLLAGKGEAQGDPLGYFNRAVELDPGEARYHETRGLHYSENGQCQLALADFDRAIALSPRAYLYHLRGYCRAERGQFPEARKDFDRAIREQPNNDQFYEGMAFTELLSGNPEEALKWIDKAISMAPNYLKFRFSRGIILEKLNRHAEAQPLLANGSCQKPEPDLARWWRRGFYGCN